MATTTSNFNARRVSLLVAMAAVTAVSAGVVARGANASAASTQVSGTFSFANNVVTGCPLGAVACSSGTVTGGVNGSLASTLLSTLPSPTVGVIYFDGKMVLSTTAGDLRCDLNGASNLNANSEGEFASICVITGGTGGYANATGDLRLVGTSTKGLVIPSSVSGTYVGTIKTS